MVAISFKSSVINWDVYFSVYSTEAAHVFWGAVILVESNLSKSSCNSECWKNTCGDGNRLLMKWEFIEFAKADETTPKNHLVVSQ